MHRFRSGFFLLLIALASLGAKCGKKPTTADSGFEGQFLQILNNHRQSLGLSQVQAHSGIHAVADAHSQDMCQRQFFAHVNPSGEDPSQRLLKNGIGHSALGENLAKYSGYQPTAQQLFNDWLASPPHKAVMEMNTAINFAGLGTRLNCGDGWSYFTLMLAKIP